MVGASQNPLISTTRASDGSPSVQLHPLVLLTISDCITRHTIRQQTGPIVGAILGAQDGQNVSMEVAFQAKLEINVHGDVVLDEEWFSKRLEDFKDVHKQPPLDIVGWFTLGPSSGPGPHVLPIHSCISRLYTESPLLLLFHPETAFSEATAAGKLPLTLYESVSVMTTSESSDKTMDIDGAAQARCTKFRELVYSIETGEAEMIAVDFVARGGGNATAVEDSSGGPVTRQGDAVNGEDSSIIRTNRGKQKEKEKDSENDFAFDETIAMTAEDEEILSSLTAKMNAIRMLSRRINLLRAYLDALPKSYLSDPTLPVTPAGDAQTTLPLNYPILRSISAMLARINILAPPDSDAFNLESQQEASDVQLVNLLSSITNSVSAAQDLGRSSQILENGKSSNKGRMGGIIGGISGYGGGESNFFGTAMGAGGHGGDRMF